MTVTSKSKQNHYINIETLASVQEKLFKIQLFLETRT